jgi:hypothetical protein
MTKQPGSRRFLKLTLAVFAFALIGLGVAAWLSGELSLPFDYGGFGN